MSNEYSVGWIAVDQDDQIWGYGSSTEDALDDAAENLYEERGLENMQDYLIPIPAAESVMGTLERQGPVGIEWAVNGYGIAILVGDIA